MSTDYGICSMLHSSCNEFTPRGQWTLTLNAQILHDQEHQDCIWESLTPLIS
jgi:hypothetical protein